MSSAPSPPTKPPKNDPRQTPAMQQYYRFKRQHPDCLLLFRIGDFYEMFDDDAVAASRAIGLTLTQRTEGVPMAGLPFHQLETYLRRFMDAGFRVAVGEQIEDAAQAKGLVQRAVTRVLTPGTLVDDDLLPNDRSAALAAVCFTGSGDDSPAVLAVTDLSTGSFIVMDCAAGANAIADEIARRGVTELLYAEPAAGGAGEPPARVKAVLNSLQLSGTARPSWHFRHEEAREVIFKHYGVSTLDGFGLTDDDAALRPAGAILRYLHETQSPGSDDDDRRRRNLAHIRPPRRDDRRNWCVIDATTLRSLEILRTLRVANTGRGGANDSDGSLVGVFQSGKESCRTAMGRRFIREWLCFPLCDRVKIEERHAAVSTFISDRTAAERLGAALGEVQDVARIAGRVSLGRATPRDICALGRSLAQVRQLKDCLENSAALAGHHALLASIESALSPLAERIAALCVDSPPAHMREGGLFRDGVDRELDEARTLKQGAADWMASYQQRLISHYELPSLKVGYNKIFGYYIELPAAQSRRAPDEFTRKQTLKGAERYITPELKDFETRATSAESRALSRELAMFDDLCAAASAQTRAIVAFADAAAELDVLLCFADKAHRRGWVRPTMAGEPVLVIKQGRHPVLDELLDAGSSARGGKGGAKGFVPNDVELGATFAEGTDGQALSAAPSLALVTGPNMAGKSTYIRQVALITLLAHAGSFVPAEKAVVGLTDRIFTRLGADDALHAGQSTFMVEMTETARILHHATERSLVVLDEIGRGTSTLDGLSLAWAIAERLAGGEKASGPRTLFATHYHELTDLAEVLPGRVTNLHVAVREWGDDIIFLHRILPGATDQSYGIHVAKLAGIPGEVVGRAREVLSSIAVQHHGLVESVGAGDSGHASAASTSRAPRVGSSRASSKAADRSGQMALFTEYVPHPAVEKLREIKLEALTPLEAFDALRRLKETTEPPKKSPA